MARSVPHGAEGPLPPAQTWPAAILLGATPDPYAGDTLQLGVTRSILEALRDGEAPVIVATRSALVQRDAGLLEEIARQGRLRVIIGMATLDAALCDLLEPGASPPQERLEAMEALARHGIHPGVLLGPVLPGLNSAEIETILGQAAIHGAASADLALPAFLHGPQAGFAQWLQRRLPRRADAVLRQLAPAAGTSLGPPEPPWEEQARQRFERACWRFLLEHVAAPDSCKEFQPADTTAGH